MHSPIDENLAAILRRIDVAARACGRDPAEVRLLPVTKSVDADTTWEMVVRGRHDLGENRMQALEAKIEALEGRPGGPEGGLRWHFIGPLQSRKVRRVVRPIHELHSLDRLDLIEAVDAAARERQRPLRVWVQVNATGEQAKSGFALGDLPAALDALRRCSALVPLGLMAMGPLEERPGHGTREVFAAVARAAAEIEGRAADRALFHEGRVRLNMGMSDDLEEAVRAGSHLVRIGSALFEGLERSARDRSAPSSSPQHTSREEAG